MGDYCTLAQVREELVKQGTGSVDDAAITARIPRVTALINAKCRHSFDQETIVAEQRRGVEVIVDHDGDLQITVSKGYCQSVSAATVSGDLMAWQALDVAKCDIDGYVLTFINQPISLARNGKRFARISYVGGYATGAHELDLLAQAACRWTAFAYMKRQAPFEVIAYPDMGQVSVPSVAPGDVMEMLETFIRRRP